MLDKNTYRIIRQVKQALVLTLVFAFTSHFQSLSQEIVVFGKVATVDNNLGVESAEVFIENTNIVAKTDRKGFYEIKSLAPGKYRLIAFYLGYEMQLKEIIVAQGRYEFNFQLKVLEQLLDEIAIEDEIEETMGIARLKSVDGAGIYEAKKTEVIILKDLVANLATNNSRQVYAKVPGLNIWESDGAGLQLGIGARGLDPNRTSNFNVRQNGYDISADAMGYPESYYTPPAEAVERIEVVRGAASLQYGTQFGGLLNFKLKDGSKIKPVEVTLRQTVGSFGLLNSFNSIGGSKGKFRYYTFYQHKQADGWRPNTEFDLDMAYGSVTFQPVDHLSINGQFTHMTYNAQQPGGLTDALFNKDPRQSIRERNWFRVDWNLAALNFDYRISPNIKLNIRNFMLIGGRDALGNLERIDRTDDPNESRNLLVDDFKNFGNETRIIYNYNAFKNIAVLLVGARFYNGLTDRKQGNGPAGSEADFTFENPDNLSGSDFDFPSSNVSFFAENIFNLSNKFSVTPGIRFERINTLSEGYYQNSVLVPHPVTGIAVDSVFQVIEKKERPRSFFFAGIGLSYKTNPDIELYGNFSQNYRAINFNDIRVVNPNITVNPDIQDEKGYNFDLGVRGNFKNCLNFDASIFYLKYNDRIGSYLAKDIENSRLFRLRSNIADSRHVGAEVFAELDILQILKKPKEGKKLSLYTNFALIDAVYLNSPELPVSGNKVELVPPLNIKSGLTYIHNNFKATYQFSYTQEHYSDASNATITPSAVEGIIPGYNVMDLSVSYKYKFLTFETGVNNLSDEKYFTRRAAGYPGPGIIPSDGRSFYFTLQTKF